jgi:hypothetical protein
MQALKTAGRCFRTPGASEEPGDATRIFSCSDDGLEQEFNSLDAQREACEAYVTSQRHAG